MGCLILPTIAKAFGRAVDDEFGRKVRDACGIQPLDEKAAEIRRNLARFGGRLHVLVGQINEVVDGGAVFPA